MEKYLKLSEKEKQEIFEKAYNLGYEYEQKMGNCAQCVIAAVQDSLGIIENSVFKGAYGLAGGGGLTSLGTCGAISGAIMLIGVLYGRERHDFASGGRYPGYKLSRKIIEKFKQEYGGILCSEIQTKLMGKSFDLMDRQQYAAFEEAGGHRDKCPAVVGNGARWVAEILIDA